MTLSTGMPTGLLGWDEAHLCSPTEAERLGARVHREAVEPFLALRAAARSAGFDLAILSGFRSFEQQLSIWNRKVEGKLPVLDSRARPLNLATLSPEDLVFAILRWSALPGASRHHWGTDLDVYDARARPAGYEIELIPAEVDPGGMFGPLHEWLDGRMRESAACGFCRPYDADRHGVAPERWHLSLAPVAARYVRALTVDRLRETIASADLRLKHVVQQHLPAIFERFVRNTNPACR